MYLLLGNSHTERNDYEDAIQSFERARAQMRHHTSQPLFAISLVGFLMGVLRCVEVAQSLTDVWMEI